MKRLLSISIILLFIGMSISSSTGFNAKEQSIKPLDGKTLYVGGSGPNNYTKIQDAIDNASDGDTVFVYNGEYNEKVIVDKSINLTGENRESTVITADNKFYPVVRCDADWVNISNFTIKNSSYFGIFVFSDNNSIIDNIITNNEEDGIFIIGLYSKHNTIMNNVFENNGRWGIVVNWTTINNTISQNIIHSNTGGICLEFGAHNTTISDNNISNHTYYGIYVGSTFNIITDNIISNNTRGIHIRNKSNEIYENLFIDNENGIRIEYWDNNSIYHNDFINNTNQAYDNNNNTWDDGYPSGGNFWDDYTGNDSDGDGIGDTPYPIPGGVNEDKYPLIEPYGNWSFPPIAKFTWIPLLPYPGEIILFNASESIDDGYITLYEWDWENDGVYDENHTNYTATHTWSEYGYYPVKLRVTDNDNLTGYKTKIVRVGNLPPDAPKITGPINGKILVWYDYNFSLSDPDGDSIDFRVDWGIGGPGKLYGPFASGTIVKLNHTWDKKGIYTIRAQAIDIYGAEGEWGTLEVTMPKNRNVFFLKWFDRFPLLYQFIMRIMERWSI